MLGDDVDTALSALRAHALSLMRDECLVERRTRKRDDATLEYVDLWETIYGGACRVRASEAQASLDVQSGRQVVIVDAVVKLPVGPERIVARDRVTITHAEYDQALEGVVLWVTSRQAVTTATSRRLHVSEIAEGEAR